MDQPGQSPEPAIPTDADAHPIAPVSLSKRAVLKATGSGALLPLIDAGLVVSGSFLFFTQFTVFWLHIVFTLLSFGAFFWRFQGFTWRMIFWVSLTTLGVLWAVRQGYTEAEELI